MKRHRILLSSAILSVMPFLAHAVDPTGESGCPQVPGNLSDLICKAMLLVNPVIALLTGIAVIYFVWHVVQFIVSAGDEKGRAGAKDGILYGVVGLFVLFSFWGLVELLRASIFG